MKAQRERGFISMYILAAMLLLGLAGGAYSWVQGKRITHLTNEVARLEIAQATYKQVIENNEDVLTDIILINEECAAKRKTAEATARELRAAMKTYIERARQRRQESQDELAKASRITVCSTPVPARTTRLLIEAASSANRAKDGN